MDIKRLEYFCAIIEKEQISKAAKAFIPDGAGHELSFTPLFGDAY